MATPKDPDMGFAQVLITCNHCSKKKAELFCNNCNVNLCKVCVGQHILSLPSQRHDVIRYSLKYNETPQPLCRFHPDQKCDLFCQQCDIPVCTDCIAAKKHVHHEMRKTTSVYKEKKDIISRETHFLEEKICPRYKRIIEEIEESILDFPKSNANLKLDISKHSQELHRIVDRVINKLLSDVDIMENQDLKKMKKNLSEFQNFLSAVQEIIKRNKELLQSKQSDIINFQIHNRKLLNQPVTIAATDTMCLLVYEVSCVGVNQAWIHGNTGIITQVDENGSILKRVKTKSGNFPSGMAVSRDGDLLYTEFDLCTINLAKDCKVDVLILTDWYPSGICLTSSGDILVALCNESYNSNTILKMLKLVRYSGTLIKQEIQYDENMQQLFQSGRESSLEIADNINGDICVRDFNAESILILTKQGELKSRYDGCNVLQNPFDPNNITTDSQGQVLVSDSRNDCVYILD
ncbi:E3 ubiquitin-protein ligase TRIM9-like [Saccostrea echinata]|uniref:E3 ubiquitin-protein ligase TRIM9-like n=1 Tax=Saccostrea echinata TaxID=191078 RepID=UPI002A7FA619|nr:E3 ubiquitin-protein ligase TRIM9-like [Saccostrea echinata]